MELFRDTNINFLKYQKFWISISLILLAVGVFAVFVHGKLNVGIDFAGGTQLTLRFRERPAVDEIRSILASGGLGDAEIQRFGKTGENEIMIKTPASEGTEEGSRDRVVAALDKKYNTGKTGFDLNHSSSDALTALLVQVDPDGAGATTAEAHYEPIAAAIVKTRSKQGIFTSWDEVAAVRVGAAEGPEAAPGADAKVPAAATVEQTGTPLDPAIAKALQDQAYLGDFSIVGVENVGPQIGKELRKRGVLAVLLSLLGMLVYMWFRFELRFGIGALMASVHDVIVTLGLFALLGFEFNLTTIAAFLTLVGYSVNDTVVVFDRVRENMRKSRREPLFDIMNRSVNQTLSRTILTSGTTFLATLSLLVFGGDVIRGFAFVMTVGVIVGTYSSIYIASPFALLWERIFGSESRSRRSPSRAAESKAS
jgi:preprotein translocase subunit SecF